MGTQGYHQDHEPISDKEPEPGPDAEGPCCPDLGSPVSAALTEFSLPPRVSHNSEHVQVPTWPFSPGLQAP